VANRIFKISVLLFLILGFVTSCKTAAREEKYYEKQEKKKVAEEQKAYEKSVNDHLKIQSKETLKMMKETERESKKLNKSRKR
jgi:sortase (surface protein transpeptidase)